METGKAGAAAPAGVPNGTDTGGGPGKGDGSVTGDSPGTGNGSVASDSPGAGNGPGTSHSQVTGNGPVTSDSPGTGNGPVASDSPGAGNGPGTSHSPGTGNSPGAGDGPGTSHSPGAGDGPVTSDSQVTGNSPVTGASTADGPVWTGLPRGLLTMRRLLLLLWAVPIAVAAGVLLGIFAGPAWAAFALLPLAAAAWGWPLLERNWRSWRYAERADDLLISRGVLWHEETVVPYGRMQLVEVTSGPVERHFGLASVQLHTAAAATDARIPGLIPAEAERLRDRLTELGEARSAGL